MTHTRRVVYLEDDETAVLSADGIKTQDPDAILIDKEIHNLGFDLPAIERNGYAHFMLKEIFEQPETIRNALRGRVIRSEGTAKLGGVDHQSI